MLDIDRQPEREILDALPIFPLPNVVLLPGMVLPLNVFEPRYLAMVDHVLRGGMHIGVPLLRGLEPGLGSLEEDPPIEAVFGVGKLVAHHRLADGRRFIRLEGLGRVRVVEERPVTEAGFRRVTVEALPEAPPEALHQLEILKAQVERMAETFDPDEREMVRSVLRLEDARVVVYAIASLVPNVELMRAVRGARSLGEQLPHLRLLQRCLAAEDTDARIRILSDRAKALIDLLSESGSFPVSVLN